MNKRSTGSITQTLLDFDLGESSDDSDFRIEDHDDESDISVNSNDDDSGSSDGGGDSDDDDEEDDDVDMSSFGFARDEFKQDGESTKGLNGGGTTANGDTITECKRKEELDKATAKLLATPICCVCLGERSDDTNEIVECDNCGISVHEGCYGISDSVSVSSTVSSCSTEPWFCEACKANIVSPVCELCPNKGGIFKETDVGKWVHLVCALYVPGVAFGEVDHLAMVTLFEMQYSKWGAKTCSLCDDARFSRCGVCIGCDAGMCKTYFHVTCAQAAGLLAETHHDEADHADPFYAHCKIHSDKTQIKRRKRNFFALKVKMEYRNANADQRKMEASSSEQQRIERKLKKHRNKYISTKTMKSEPWVPTQKMPRLLSTSASASRRLLEKAELMGINTAALEFQEAQMAALADIRKKWHISPAFSVEFIGYYLDRVTRSKEIKINLQQQLELNQKLASEQLALRERYDELLKYRTELTAQGDANIEAVEKLHTALRTLCPNKTLVPIDNIGRSMATATPPVDVQPISRPMAVPTAAALKMGVGFPLTNLPGTADDSNRVLSTQCREKSSLMNECGICRRCNDQHLLAKCDTCHLHYHLGCLTPPLTRHPKKSKIYGWQCSECDEDNPEGVPMTSGPRKSRTKYAKDGTIVPVDSVFDFLDDDIKEEHMPVYENGTKSTKADKVTPPPPPEVKSEQLNENINAAEPIVLVENVLESIPNIVVPKSETKSPKKKKAKKNSKSAEGKQIPATNESLDTSIDTVNSTAPTPVSLETSSNGDVTPLFNGNSLDKPPAAKEKSKSSKKGKKEKAAGKAEKKADKKKKAAAAAPKVEEPAEHVHAPPNVEDNVQQNVQQNVQSTVEPDVQQSVDGNVQPNVVLSVESNVQMNVEPTVDGNVELKPLEPTAQHLPAMGLSNGNGLDKPEVAAESSHKHNRKRRKEKHRNKHDDERKHSPSKEHKKKRKRKSHDIENPNAAGSSDGVPKIKIKFKSLPLPGETASESHCFYVPADMVRPREFPRSRPVSVDTDEQLPTPVIDSPNECEAMPAPALPLAIRAIVPPPIRSRRMSIVSPPPKAATAKRSLPSPVACQSTPEPTVQLKCDTCHAEGTSQELVRCDECTKCYHFGCLMPPLKKTPKRRGYSWHCADCDPTDKEDN